LHINAAALPLALVTCWLTCASPATAQITMLHGGNSAETEDAPTTFKMTVSPAPEPRPALKYHFLVPPVDQIKGNAATFYYKALGVEGPDPFVALGKLTHDEEMHRRIFEAPFNEFPHAELENILPLTDSIDALKEASRCHYFDWGDPIREFGISTLLPQSQRMRSVAMALAAQARQQMIQGKTNDAIDTLRYAYALSRNLDRGVCLVQCLIGMAVQGIIDEQTRALIAVENSPNLYWALTELASHSVDLRQALSYETQMWEFSVPELAELDRRIFTPREALELFDRLAKTLSLTYHPGHKDRFNQFREQVSVMALTLHPYPQARSYLLELGYDGAKVDAMPILQTVLLYWWKQFEIARDDTFKWLFLPDSEVNKHLSRSDRAAKEASVRREGGVFTTLLPAIHASSHANIRFRRQTDLLRAVEALRMYAAEHGRWPETLADVTVVPVPIDPWTERPFLYSVKDGVAILEMSPTPHLAGGLRVNHRYELTLRKSKSQ
jgi:hypothetical protein